MRAVEVVTIKFARFLDCKAGKTAAVEVLLELDSGELRPTAGSILESYRHQF